MTYRISKGQAFRRSTTAEEEQPVRTKIVATLGNSGSHRDGILDLDGKALEQSAISTRLLVREFIANGVDVIRLNLTWTTTDLVAGAYQEVKRAILECEREHATHKRVAVLADLPGPKIRFNFSSEARFRDGASFLVRFSQSDDDSVGLVYMDQHPLRDAMDAADRRTPWFPITTPDARIADSVLGVRSTASARTHSTYASMLDKIETELPSGDVLVRVGDGDVVLRVNRVIRKTDSLECTVLSAKTERLEGKKGFTLKGVDLDVPSFTDEDQAKLDALLTAEYAGCESDDWQPVLAFVAVSFAQTAHDILRVKRYMYQTVCAGLKRRTARSDFDTPAVVAKIESDKGWNNRQDILDVADGLMVARGDLGLQKEIENVPAMQKRLISLCNKCGKPVITATEMLKSMTKSVEPTRAEGTDVFNAILDGSDAVMLSEETSQGRFPFHAIKKMIAIAVEAEQFAEWGGLELSQRRAAQLQKFQAFFVDADELIRDNANRLRMIYDFLGRDDEPHAFGDYLRKHDAERLWYRELYGQKTRKARLQHTTDRITQAACLLSESDDIKSIVAATTSGRTVRMIARMKPRVVVIGAAHDVLNARKLTVSYGVWPLCIGDVTEDEGPEGMYKRCLATIADCEPLSALLTHGEVIFTAGTPVAAPWHDQHDSNKTF